MTAPRSIITPGAQSSGARSQPNEAELHIAATVLFVEVAGGLNDHAVVPACPAWDVHDLIAHQAHQLAAACDGTFPTRDAIDAMTAPDRRSRDAAGRRQADWVAAGLAQRKAASTADVVGAWRESIALASDAALAALLPDVAVHLFDALGVCRSAGHRDHPLVAASLARWRSWSEARMRQIGRGPLRLDLTDTAGTSAIGPANAGVVVSGTGFELLRAITGRRSRGQAGALRWEGADDASVEQFSVYGWRENDLAE